MVTTKAALLQDITRKVDTYGEAPVTADLLRRLFGKTMGLHDLGAELVRDTPFRVKSIDGMTDHLVIELDPDHPGEE